MGVTTPILFIFKYGQYYLHFRLLYCSINYFFKNLSCTINKIILYYETMLINSAINGLVKLNNFLIYFFPEKLRKIMDCLLKTYKMLSVL